MGYVPDEVIEALRSSHTLGIFMRIDTTPTGRFWMGTSDIPIKFKGTSIEADGGTYIGGGVLGGIPTLEALINDVAERVEFQMSGLTQDQSAIFNANVPEVRGKKVHVGFTVLDTDYKPVSDIIPIWTGSASFFSERSPPVGSTETPLITMALSVASGAVTRSRPSASLWSHAHQQALYPTDDFCKGTARLARGVAPSWPRY